MNDIAENVQQSYPGRESATVDTAPVHAESGRLAEALQTLDDAVGALAARLVPVTFPGDDGGAQAFGRLRETAVPSSPLTEGLRHSADEVERIADRVRALTSTLEI